MPRKSPSSRVPRSAPANAGANPIFFPPGSLYAVRARTLLGRLPPLAGAPISLFPAAGLCDGAREVHAGSFLRRRSIAFNCRRGEFARICVHELFHFVWLRLGNQRRRSYEDILRKERAAAARGELGWSAEWRKRGLSPRDVETRTRRWRQYCCESFCDTAAWIYSGVPRHEEFTLACKFRERRRAWFRRLTSGALLPI